MFSRADAKLIFCIGCLLLSPSIARAGQPAVSVKPREPWGCVFGGEEVEFHFSVSSLRRFTGRAGWALRVAQRVVARRETALTVEPAKPGTISTRFALPEVKEGVVMPASLAVSVLKPGAPQPESAVEKQLWVFPRDPFALRKDWLKARNIHLFDPEDTTKPALKALEIPFTSIRNLETVHDLKDALLLIGEGVSFRDYRALSALMLHAAARGLPVVCLAPAGGQATILDPDDEALPSPNALRLRRADVIRQLDKRLDRIAWPPDGRIVQSSLVLRGERGPVVGVVTEGGEGWPWLELSFGPTQVTEKKGGQLIICGFGIIDKWEAGPTPRFLFARMLEYVCGRE